MCVCVCVWQTLVLTELLGALVGHISLSQLLGAAPAAHLTYMEADLSLCRAHRLFCWFCHAPAHLY